MNGKRTKNTDFSGLTGEPMATTLGVLKEIFPGECRVAIVPANVSRLEKIGLQVLVEAGAGVAAGYPDASYEAAGATITDRSQILSAELIAGIRLLGAGHGVDEGILSDTKTDCVLIGMCDPLGSPESLQRPATSGKTVIALEMIPRITRAQSMDVLSSMATIAGYKAVLTGASELPRMFPLLMTAAGTVQAARVFVIGAGVAGLQSLATAKRLGAKCQGYDVRAACSEQVESVGAKFIELSLPETSAEDQGGYAKELAEDFYIKQRELMASVVAESDLVITTAAIPGKPSPLLITEQAVAGMEPGSVIIDLAAERGGNCEVSQADQRIQSHGVTILGPTNLPSEVPYHASQMFSNNVTHYLHNLIKDGEIVWNMDDEIISETAIVHRGQVVHPRIKSLLETEPEPVAPTTTASSDSPVESDSEPSSEVPSFEEFLRDDSEDFE